MPLRVYGNGKLSGWVFESCAEHTPRTCVSLATMSGDVLSSAVNCQMVTENDVAYMRVVWALSIYELAH